MKNIELNLIKVILKVKNSTLRKHKSHNKSIESNNCEDVWGWGLGKPELIFILITQRSCQTKTWLVGLVWLKLNLVYVFFVFFSGY